MCTGLSYTQLQEFFVVVGLQIPLEKHFYNFQRGSGRDIGWADTILKVWEEEKQRMWSKLMERNEGVVLYIDECYDSSRHACHGITPLIDSRIGKVLEMVTRTRKECGNPWRIEEVGIEEGLKHLQDAGVQIIEGIHDDKNSIDMLLQNLGIVPQIDL